MAAEGDIAYAPDRMGVVLLGDSITQQSFQEGGWGHLLSDYYVRRADVFNRGFSGYNTEWILQQLGEGGGMMSRLYPRPRIVTVFFGANDAALIDGVSPDKHVPVAQYGENLKRIVEMIREQTDDVKPHIILIAPPPVVREEDRNDATSAKYSAECVRVAAELAVPVVDVRSAMLADGSWERFLSDGLHLSKEGNAVVFRELVRTIEATCDLTPTKLPMHHPHHSLFAK